MSRKLVNLAIRYKVYGLAYYLRLFYYGTDVEELPINYDRDMWEAVRREDPATVEKLWDAVRHTDSAMIEILLFAGIHALDEHPSALLHVAAANNDLKLLNLCISIGGMDINNCLTKSEREALPNYGSARYAYNLYYGNNSTPLLDALAGGHSDAMGYLLSRNTNTTNTCPCQMSHESPGRTGCITAFHRPLYISSVDDDCFGITTIKVKNDSYEMTLVAIQMEERFIGMIALLRIVPYFIETSSSGTIMRLQEHCVAFFETLEADLPKTEQSLMAAFHLLLFGDAYPELSGSPTIDDFSPFHFVARGQIGPEFTAAAYRFLDIGDGVWPRNKSIPADTNAKGPNGRTPIWVAVLKEIQNLDGKETLLRTMLDRQPNLNLCDLDGESLLRYAVRKAMQLSSSMGAPDSQIPINNLIKVIRLLRDHGMDVGSLEDDPVVIQRDGVEVSLLECL